MIGRIFVKGHEDFFTAANLSRAGWSWGCAAAVDSRGRTIFVADAHCSDGHRFIVRADEKLTALVELESAIGGRGEFLLSPLPLSPFFAAARYPVNFDFSDGFCRRKRWSSLRCQRTNQLRCGSI